MGVVYKVRLYARENVTNDGQDIRSKGSSRTAKVFGIPNQIYPERESHDLCLTILQLYY